MHVLEKNAGWQFVTEILVYIFIFWPVVLCYNMATLIYHFQHFLLVSFAVVESWVYCHILVHAFDVLHAYLYHKYCMFFGNFFSYNLYIFGLCRTESIVDNLHCYLNKMSLERKGTISHSKKFS